MLHSGHYINAGFVSWPQSVYLSIFYGISYALQASGHLLYLQCFEMHAMQHTRQILLSITATKLLAAALMPNFEQHSQSKSHMPSQTTNLDLWKLQPHLLPAAFGKPGIMRVAYHCHFVTLHRHAQTHASESRIANQDTGRLKYSCVVQDSIDVTGGDNPPQNPEAL